MELDTIYQGDALEIMEQVPSESVDCVITSPPYFSQRDYGVDGQLGLEGSIGEYIDRLIEIFAEVRRALKDSGTCWVNIGDTYASGGGKGISRSWANEDYHPDNPPKARIRKHQPKCLLQIPQRFSIAMVDRLGWTLRNWIVWRKPNPIPESVRDRLAVTWEPFILFAKNPRYYFDLDAIRVPHKTGPAKFNYRVREAKSKRRGAKLVGAKASSAEKERHDSGGVPIGEKPGQKGKNPGDVWTIPPAKSFSLHLTAFPEKLVEPAILAGSPPGGVVLDPFIGSGTVAAVAKRLGRHFIGIELNPETVKFARWRVATTAPPLPFAKRGGNRC